MMLGLMIWMSTPVASISAIRSSVSVMRWNSGSGMPCLAALVLALTPCANSECS